MLPWAAFGVGCVLAMAAPSPVRAAAPTAALVSDIDPSRAHTEFSLRVAWVRRISGRFDFIQGQVRQHADRQHFDVDISIAAQSLSMDNPDHAAWARSEEFFDAERHPWVRFRARDVPMHILHTGGRLIGWLTLRGQEGAADFEITPSTCPDPGFGCAVEAEGEISRSHFGLNARRWVVSDKVQLKLSFSLRDADSASDPGH